MVCCVRALCLVGSVLTRLFKKLIVDRVGGGGPRSLPSVDMTSEATPEALPVNALVSKSIDQTPDKWNT